MPKCDLSNSVDDLYCVTHGDELVECSGSCTKKLHCSCGYSCNKIQDMENHLVDNHGGHTVLDDMFPDWLDQAWLDHVQEDGSDCDD